MKNISVIGSGTMGNGIAHVFAQNNFNVSLIDVNPAALEKALATIAKISIAKLQKEVLRKNKKNQALANITTYTSIAEGVKNAELVVEAATENQDLKIKIFMEMDAHAPEGCILASNTSSISITKLASVTKRPGKVIGMHFMNPVPVMKLVEVINGFTTETEVSNLIIELSKSIGKVPALANDYPGFLANRLLMPMINEAIYALHESVGGVNEIDTIMKLGMSHPNGTASIGRFYWA
jgi:3-hydroxybutyryl-CoA dehydrogenase